MNIGTISECYQQNSFFTQWIVLMPFPINFATSLMA